MTDVHASASIYELTLCNLFAGDDRNELPVSAGGPPLFAKRFLGHLAKALPDGFRAGNGVAAEGLQLSAAQVMEIETYPHK